MRVRILGRCRSGFPFSSICYFASTVTMWEGCPITKSEESAIYRFTNERTLNLRMPNELWQFNLYQFFSGTESLCLCVHGRPCGFVSEGSLRLAPPRGRGRVNGSKNIYGAPVCQVKRGHCGVWTTDQKAVVGPVKLHLSSAPQGMDAQKLFSLFKKVKPHSAT